MPAYMAYRWILIVLWAVLCAGCAAPNAELIAMNERAYLMEAQVEREAAELARMKGDIQTITRQAELMQGAEIAARLSRLESGISAGEGAMSTRLRVKVLGRRGLEAAREAAAHLAEHGIAVSVIDLAPADDGSGAAAVYYAEGFEQEARDAARALGGSIELRPMKWASVFELIIITGGR